MGQLRDQMLADLQLRGMAATTQKDDLLRLRHLAKHFGRSPSSLREADLRAYLHHARTVRKLSASSLCMYVAAFKFFYTVTLKRPGIVGAPLGITAVLHTWTRDLRLQQRTSRLQSVALESRSGFAPVGLQEGLGTGVGRWLLATQLGQHRIVGGPPDE